MAEPRPVKLGEVADFLTGFPFKSAHYTDDAVGIRLIRGDNIIQGAMRWEGVKRWPAHLANQSEGYRLFPGDVVLAMDRPWIEAGLKYAALSDDDCPSLLVQRVTRLRGTERIDKGFLRYVIGGRHFTDYVLAVQTGTAVPHISGGQIKAFQFLLPDIAEQRSIASVLGALDDKIELNRRMNETLEAMARAIFKDWFVDFGPTRAKAEGHASYLAPDLWSLFPARLDEKGKPKGWENQAVFAQAKWVNGAAYKNMYFNKEPDSLPVIKIVELKNGITESTKFTNTSLGDRYRIDDGELLFSWSGNPDTSIDAFLWTHGQAWLNQHIFAVRSNDTRSTCFLYIMLKILKPELSEIARNKQTTGLGHVTIEDLKRMRICVPDTAVEAAFEETAAPLLQQLYRNRLESQTLAQTREFLLPKLMSGEIRVREAEAMLAAAQ